LKLCNLCKTELIVKNWKIDFRIDAKFISILNFPILLCPKCASVSIRQNISERVLDKIFEKIKSRKTTPRAIKFEEHF
jgi:hypothetical protein